MNNFYLLFFAAILPSLFAQKFMEVTDSSGLAASRNSNGIAVADYDLDGDLDVYIVGHKRYDAEHEDTWNRLFRNNGDGTFMETTEQAGVTGNVSSPTDGFEGTQYGAAWGDYDNDGDPDLYFSNFGYNVLYQNNGNGTFTDVTEAAVVKGDRFALSSSACWWDYDLDGDLDLYVCNLNSGENILYENVGKGVFIDITKNTGLGDKGTSWSAIPFDANNDRLTDLYVVNDFGANTFYLNQGDSTFVKATQDFGLENEGHGMGVTLGDYNNDGFFDIYLTNISSMIPSPLFENQGNGTFIDKAAEVGIDDTGWAWGTEFFDFDHDGGLDLYVVNGHSEEPAKNYLFYNILESPKVSPELREATFWDISDTSNVDSGIEAHSLVTFDYDDDGDLDMLVGNFWTQPHLFENRSQTKNWLKVELQGTISNRNAFGASVSISCAEKKYYRFNDGVDFLGQSILPLHFGVADAELIDTLTVTWPTGEKEQISNISVNQTIKIIEQQGLVSGIQDKLNSITQPDFYLIGNYPNPFNGNTRILFNTPNKGIAQIKIFSISGQEISSRNYPTKKGKNSIQWQGNDMTGHQLSSGLYLYTISYNNFRISGKMLYIK